MKVAESVDTPVCKPKKFISRVPLGLTPRFVVHNRRRGKKARVTRRDKEKTQKAPTTFGKEERRD